MEADFEQQDHDGRLQYLVTEVDVARNAQRPNLPDVASTQTWARQQGFSWPTPLPGQYPDPYAEKNSVTRAYVMRQQSGTAGPNVTGEFMPAFVPMAQRNQLLVLTLAGGLGALLLYSFWTRKPLIE